MSSKNVFLKLQENNEAQQSGEASVQAEIKTFRARVFDLCKGLNCGCTDRGIQVTRTEIMLSDDTVTPQNTDSRYSISHIRMQNGQKTAVLRTEGLYHQGSTGLVK